MNIPNFYKTYTNCAMRPTVFKIDKHFRGYVGANLLNGDYAREALFFCFSYCMPIVKFQPADTRYENVIDEHVIYIHPIASGFPHTITEGLARLWYVTYDKHSPLLFAYPERFFPKFIKDILDILNIKNKILFVEKPTLFKKITFPYPGLTLHANLEEHHAKSIGVYSAQIVKGKKIYLSRSHLPESYQGHTVDDAKIDRLFEKYGYKIIYPEEIPFKDQLKELAESETVAGIEGGAFHNILFLKDPVKTRFISIARHHKGWGVYDHIKKIKKLNYTTINLNKDNSEDIDIYNMNIDFEKLEELLKSDFDPDAISPVTCKFDFPEQETNLFAKAISKYSLSQLVR